MPALGRRASSATQGREHGMQRSPLRGVFPSLDAAKALEHAASACRELPQERQRIVGRGLAAVAARHQLRGNHVSSNFLAVHRVRPSEEAAGNSDDDDADTVLDLSVEHFREALEPPAREIAAGTKSKLASEELIVAACKRASAAWASSDGTPADGRNPFAHSDAKQLLRTARQKRRRLPCDSAAA